MEKKPKHQATASNADRSKQLSPSRSNIKRGCKEKALEEPVWISEHLMSGRSYEKDLKSQIFQNGVCRCCLSEGYFKSMELPNCAEEISDNYATLVQTTLGLSLERLEKDRLICNACETRLTDSFVFRKQVVNAEMIFLKNSCDKSNGEVVNNVSISNKKQDEKELNIENMEPDDYNMNYIMPVDVKLELSSDSDDNLPLSQIPAIKSEPCRKYKRKKKKEESIIIWVKCDHCTKKFKNKHRQQKHRIKAHFSCKACKIEFNSILEKDEHVLSKHPFLCEVCKSAFATSDQKFKHVTATHGRKCTFCNERFMQRALLRHKVQVHNAPMMQCNICDRKFYTKADLIVHQRKIHMNEKNVSCQMCDYIGFDKASLAKHVTSHREKKLQCRFCMKKFSRQSHLDFHERIHTGDKRKVCKICGEAFVQRASLKYHLEKYHPEDFY